MNTTENNILIAEFMGFSLAEEIAPKLYINSKEKKQMYLHQMAYHSSWDWLMAVVEKIEKKHEFNTKLWYNRTRKEYQMQLFYTDFYKDIIVNSKVKIEAVYNAVIEFIKWYNEQK